MSNSIYSGKLRVRVAGLLIEEGKLLLVKLKSPVSNQDIWTPPGGGVEFGETMKDALKREFQEETGLTINVDKILHINELIKPPFHAIEFFFKVNKVRGDIKLGFDPEQTEEGQILKQIDVFSKNEIRSLLIKPEELKTLPIF